MKKTGKQPPLTEEEMWRMFLTEGFHEFENTKRLFRLLPSNPRCKACYVPFKGFGGVFARTILNRGPSSHNPSICNVCEQFATKNPGGAEIDLAMVFADIRGSTALAEKMHPREFSELINRFYNVALDIFIQNNAFIDRLVGDEMIGYFLPGTAGSTYTATAIKASMQLLKATGNIKGSEPWVSIGIGVHKGNAYFGAVGQKNGVTDITALGDSVNTTARLASQAGPGELLISEEAYQASGLILDNLEDRILFLKGRSAPASVKVFRE
jgi:adenylate cyclase